MDKVTLEGKVYERSAIVAKRYGYTADYLGQLSRSEKVDAQLVGRSWYVHAPSVESYQASLEEEDDASVTTESKRPASLSKTSTTNRDHEPAESTVDVTTDNKTYHIKIHTGSDEISFIDKVSRPNDEPTWSQTATSATVPVNERTKPRSTRPARSRFSPASSGRSARNWQKVAYEQDNDTLVPTVEKDCVVPPVQEIGKRIRVHSNTEKFSLVASAMPEVSLRGEVAIKSVDDPSEEALSLHYQAANTRVRQQLTEFTPTHRRSAPEARSHHPKARATESESARPVGESKHSRATIWVTRVAWGCTILLLSVALAGMFLARETTYREAGDATSGFTFAPADWWYQIWPF
jgi:hypothetical protein